MDLMDKLRDCQHEFSDWVIRTNPGIGLDKRAEAFVKMFEHDLAPASRVLDIGSGPGVYYEPLTRRGHQVTLLDMKQYKSCRYPTTLFDGGKYPFEDKTFDVSLLVTVLHHTSDPEATLLEAKRVTSGTVVVIEDVYTGFPGRVLAIVRDAALNFEFIGHPMNFRSYLGWKETFSRLGFTLQKERDFYSYLMNLPIHTGLYILKP